eukprot:Platyproteum_vivax@DN330_c0_g1_i2.p1
MPDEQVVENPEREEEEEEKYGLLENTFLSGGQSTHQEKDVHLEAYLEKHLNPEPTESESEPKRKEDTVYEIPEDLQVPDNSEEAAEKMHWVTGLVEVALPIEYKLENIEVTERAKQSMIAQHRSKVGVPTPGSLDLQEQERLLKSAFGSRFQAPYQTKPAPNHKGSTDDIVLERYRKRFRRF